MKIDGFVHEVMFTHQFITISPAAAGFNTEARPCHIPPPAAIDYIGEAAASFWDLT